MNWQIRWKDCDRSKAVEAGVKQSLSTLAKYNFINEDVKVEIVHYDKRNTFKARINVHVKGKNIMRAEATSSTIYGAVNSALDKLEDQLRRQKTKMRRGK